LSKHGFDNRAVQLIVSLRDPEDRFHEHVNQVAALLNDSDVRTIYAKDLRGARRRSPCPRRPDAVGAPLVGALFAR